MADAWTDEQNDATVAVYFEMLQAELAAKPYVKIEHNRRLQERIGKGRGPIEFKFQNVSAVLKGIGEAWIDGYKPLFNFQSSLEEAVQRWLSRHPEWLMRLPEARRERQRAAEVDQPILWVGPPPTVSNAPPPNELEQTMAIARRFDVAARDARNRALGRAGEERVLAHEHAMLVQAGRRDLAERISWISEELGDGAGYDIGSFESDGRLRLIEVKTTNGWERTPFHISRNELAVAEAKRSEWCLVRLWNFARDAKAFEIRPPLEAHLALTPTSFQAMLL